GAAGMVVAVAGAGTAVSREVAITRVGGVAAVAGSARAGCRTAGCGPGALRGRGGFASVGAACVGVARVGAARVGGGLRGRFGGPLGDPVFGGNSVQQVQVSHHAQQVDVLLDPLLAVVL